MKRRLSTFAFHGHDGFGDVPNIYPSCDEVDLSPIQVEKSKMRFELQLVLKMKQAFLAIKNKIDLTNDSLITRAWTVQNKRFFSKVSQNTVR